MNPIKFFKRLSVTKKVMTISITLLIIGYIFCLPRQLFHVPDIYDCETEYARSRMEQKLGVITVEEFLEKILVN